MPRTRIQTQLASLGLLLALAATGQVLAAPAGNGVPDEHLYRLAADQNRYLIKELWTPGSEPQPKAPYYMSVASNMEPRIVHCEQIAESLAKLKAKNYCTQAIPSQVLKACPNLQPFTSGGGASCKRPNILIFLVDDMGWGDFQPFGGGVTFGAATPATSKLAQNGLLLTSTYSQPTCSPSRATIHTGQLPVHHGVLYPPMYGDPGGINASSIPLPMLLKKAGYFTKGTGKWHMGENIDNLPQNIGYDEYLGFLSVSDMYTEWRDQYFNPEVVRDEARTTYMDHSKFSHYMIHSTHTPSEEAKALAKVQSQESGEEKSPGCQALAEITLPWEANALDGDENRGNTNHCWVKPEDKKKKVSIADLDRIWADDSVAFIERMKDKNEPWFLYHATRGCHFDNYPNTGDRRYSYARTVYSDCTAEMDQTLGRLMKALADSGQEQETLVFFTSDNGPEDEIPPHGHTPFRGGKGDTWEGGVRVPGIAFWPGMIEAGRISDGLFDQADLYTTALNLAGINYADPGADPVIAAEPTLVKKLEKRYLYGIDQTSFLLAKEGASNRRSELHWWLTNFGAVRMDELKAHIKVTEPLGLSQGYPGGLSGVDLKVSYLWMFNLQEDPEESNNINIRHLWAQHLFSGEFNRFMCVLTRYPPHLPTLPTDEMQAMSMIQGLTDSLKYYYEACHGWAPGVPKPPGKGGGS